MKFFESIPTSLSTAAIMLLCLGGVDFALELVEMAAAYLTGAESINLWCVLAPTGILLLIVSWAWSHWNWVWGMMISAKDKALDLPPKKQQQDEEN